jgi:hypothetical protein
MVQDPFDDLVGNVHFSEMGSNSPAQIASVELLFDTLHLKGFAAADQAAGRSVGSSAPGTLRSHFSFLSRTAIGLTLARDGKSSSGI